MDKDRNYHFWLLFKFNSANLITLSKRNIVLKLISVNLHWNCDINMDKKPITLTYVLAIFERVKLLILHVLRAIFGDIFTVLLCI